MPRFSLPRRGANLRWATLLLLTGVCIATVHATTVRRLTLPDMVERSDDVVRARVLENLVRTDPDTHIHWTVTSFQVLEPVKGPMRAGELFDMEVIGGEAPGSGYATVVADAPRFSRDEEVILFIYTTRDKRRQPVGFFQGAVRLRPGAAGLMAVGAPADLRNEVVRPVSRGKAALHILGTAAPADASPAVGRGRTPTRGEQGAGSLTPGTLPAEAFMGRLHDLAGRDDVQP
ncbi:MAG: hypothetical protein O7C74_07830 [Acidobacteria bacterium]|nr:hypothetical protein [Acidobacteriota bacterium]